MNRRRLVLIGVCAVLLGGAVSIAVYRILNTAILSARAVNTTVVAAATDLAVGTRITEQDLKLARVVGSDLPEGYFRTTSELVGRGVIAPIARNEVVLANRLAAEKAGSGLPSMIPSGKRAVAVKVNDVIGVAGFALPGTRVDVVLTGQATQSTNPADVSATTVLQNVQVLAAGQKLQTNADGKPETVQVITLLVDPEEAQKLALATQEGRIQLALRNPLDLESPSVPIIKNGTLYGGAPAKPSTTRRPAPKVVNEVAAAARYQVETIKGNQRDVTSFSEPAAAEEPK